MKNIKTFSELINEKFNYEKDHKPLEGECGVTIDKIKYTFKVKKIIAYAKQNYNIKEIKVSELVNLSLFKDLDKLNNSEFKTFVDGKWKFDNELTDKERADFIEKQEIIIMKSDLRYPIVLAISDKGVYSIIDGNHRVTKAHNLKNKTIRAYVIPESDLKNAEIY
jgi:hypothetical protein